MEGIKSLSCRKGRRGDNDAGEGGRRGSSLPVAAGRCAEGGGFTVCKPEQLERKVSLQIFHCSSNIARH